MVYADINVSNSTTLLDIVVYINRVAPVPYLFSRLLVLSTFVIMLLYMRPYGNGRALLVSSFTAASLSLLLMAGGLLLPSDTNIINIFFFGSVLLMIVGKKYVEEQ
jgi:hypothetical protein